MYKYADWGLVFAFWFVCVFNVESTLLLCIFVFRLTFAVQGLKMGVTNNYTITGDLTVTTPHVDAMDIKSGTVKLGDAALRQE